MIPTSEIFTLFFVTLGPLKTLGPFVQRTREVTDVVLQRIAFWSFVIATVSVVAGGLLGANLSKTWHVSVPALTLTVGVVFFLVALKQLLEQYQPQAAAPGEGLPASPMAAAARIVFPIVLTPYGIAGVIGLLAASSDARRTEAILGFAILIMVLDLAAMLFARRILVGFTMIVLQVLGAVLAVLQVALSIEFILFGLRALKVISG